MPAGVRHVVSAATIVLLIALAAPAGAMAGGCNASACKVYHESGAPNAGGQQQPKQQPQQQQQPQPTGSTSNGGKQKQAPTKLSRVLANAGQNKVPLSRLLNDSGVGALAAAPASASSPSALGAAFDLGAGPMVLLAILLATAVAFAVQGGVRGWLRRRSGV